MKVILLLALAAVLLFPSCASMGDGEFDMADLGPELVLFGADLDAYADAVLQPSDPDTADDVRTVAAALRMAGSSLAPDQETYERLVMLLQVLGVSTAEIDGLDFSSTKGRLKAARFVVATMRLNTDPDDRETLSLYFLGEYMLGKWIDRVPDEIE